MKIKVETDKKIELVKGSSYEIDDTRLIIKSSELTVVKIFNWNKVISVSEMK